MQDKRLGFSLLELVVYMALLAIVMIVIVQIFVGIGTGRGKSEAQAEVNSNLRFAFQEIQNDLRAATSVSTPTPAGISSSILQMTTASGTVIYCVSSSTLWRATTITPGVMAWGTTTALPIAISNHFAVAYNGYVYSIGGNLTPTVNYAPISSTGSLGAWSQTTALPSAINRPSSVVYNGYVYSIGGSADGGAAGATSTVNYALINSTGSLGAWSQTTALPSATYGQATVVYNGYVYSIGGFSGVGTSTVFYAQTICNGDAITDNTVLINNSVFTRLENTNTLLGKTAVSIKIDMSIGYNATGPENQYSEEEITTVALRN
jgi:type II secretory pathway pseudopilin PulG